MILPLTELKDRQKPTLGVFLSVFLLTSTGLSYLTKDAFGGIIFNLFLQCKVYLKV